MASLRGGQSLWDAETVSDGEVSVLGLVGPGPYVAIYIKNSGAVNATFAIEVSATSSPQAGRNYIDDSDPDGGVTWYTYVGPSSLAVNAGDNIAFDLSPFGPPLIRLKRDDGGADTTITALLTSFGPN